MTDELKHPPSLSLNNLLSALTRICWNTFEPRVDVHHWRVPASEGFLRAVLVIEDASGANVFTTRYKVNQPREFASLDPSKSLGTVHESISRCPTQLAANQHHPTIRFRSEQATISEITQGDKSSKTRSTAVSRLKIYGLYRGGVFSEILRRGVRSCTRPNVLSGAIPRDLAKSIRKSDKGSLPERG